MNLSEAIRFSFQALKANRLRTFLTALGLIIGNASVILVVTISLASKDLILDQIRGIGSNLIYAVNEVAGVNVAKFQDDFIKISDVQALREELGNQIVAASAVINMHDQIVVNGSVRLVTVDGVDQYYARVRNLVILRGRAFDESDITLRERVAMLTDKLAIRLFGSQDAALGQTVKIEQFRFTVMKYFMPYERIEPVYLEARNAADVPSITQEVERMLQNRHRPGAKYDVENLSAILDTAESIANVLTVVLIVISTIALVISGIGIMNIMLVTVTERTREIGIRMAIGASRREILLQFLVEAVLISLIGGLLGILVGLAIPLSVRFITDIRVPISLISVLVAFAVSFTVGVAFGLLPARRASQLNPTEALRYE